MKTSHWILVSAAAFASVAAISISLLHIGGARSEDTEAVAASRGNSGVPESSILGPQLREGSRRPLAQAPVTGESAAIAAACATIREQGDYRPLRECLLQMSTNDRFGPLFGELMRLRSRLGNGHDYFEKIAIIAEFGGERSAFLKNRLLKSMGKDLDPVGDRAFITSLDLESWKAAASGAAEQNANKAFELAMADLGDEYQRTACAEVTRVWLGLDSNAVSKRVGAMPKGPLKDVAVSEMVSWLVAKGNAAEVTSWIAEISDKELMEKMASLAGNQRR